MIERLELPNGQWADMRASPLHGQYVRVMAAQERAVLGRGTFEEAGAIRGRELTTAWHVFGEDGQLLPCDDEGWEDCPAEVSVAICLKAGDLWDAWQEARRPKATPRKRSRQPGRRTRATGRSSDATSGASPSG